MVQRPSEFPVQYHQGDCGKDGKMCKYCDIENGTEDILRKNVVVLNEKILFELFLLKNEIGLCSGGNYDSPLAKKKIKYCPMCGRKLDEVR